MSFFDATFIFVMSQTAIPLDSNSILQVRSSAVVVYQKRCCSGVRRNLRSNFAKGQSSDEKNYSGTITAHVRRRIKKAVNLLMQISESKLVYNPILFKQVPHRLSFITLTIPDTDVDRDAATCYDKLLKPFLQWMTKTEGVTTYIWKAELQKRGYVHYHITTPTWLHYRQIKTKWNYLLKKAGMLEKFNSKFNHYNPNSTDVHEVYKVNDLEAYLEKYLSKAHNDESVINSKCWDCSLNLKGTKYFTVQAAPVHYQRLYALAQKDLVVSVPIDYLEYYKLLNVKGESVLYGNELLLYWEHLDTIRNYKRKLANRDVTRKVIATFATQLQLEYLSVNH